MSIDPVDLTARLIRCPSVTPEEGGALVLLEEVLSAAGFAVRTERPGKGGYRHAVWLAQKPLVQSDRRQPEPHNR